MTKEKGAFGMAGSSKELQESIRTVHCGVVAHQMRNCDFAGIASRPLLPWVTVWPTAADRAEPARREERQQFNSAESGTTLAARPTKIAQSATKMKPQLTCGRGSKRAVCTPGAHNRCTVEHVPSVVNGSKPSRCQSRQSSRWCQ